MQKKIAEEIIDLKKKTDRLIVENAQLVATRGEVEVVVDEPYQHIYESTTELDAVTKSKQLGEVIV